MKSAALDEKQHPCFAWKAVVPALRDTCYFEPIPRSRKSAVESPMAKTGSPPK
jgi:hypothetical protein